MTTLKELATRRTSLSRELQQVDSEIAGRRKEINTLQDRIKTIRGGDQTKVASKSTSVSSRRHKRRGKNDISAAEAAANVISSAGRALNLDELVHDMKDAGYHFTQGDPAQSLGIILYPMAKRGETFEKVAPRTFALLAAAVAQ